MLPAQYALNEYRQTTVDAGAAYADPHMLVSMLFNGLQEKLAVAKGAMARKDHSERGTALSRAIDIVGYLQSCLDLEKGGKVAANLDALYDYMTLRLLQASAANDADIVDEVQGIGGGIQESWDAIRKDAVKLAASQPERMEG
jgi:flagellar secretion chaperone FliS